MVIAKRLLMFLLAVVLAIPVYFGMATPSDAVELTLGGFPSYMRTRARFIKNATFISALSKQQAKDLGFTNNDDQIFFVDTTLRLTPQLILSDTVTIRAQFNVFDNNIWGGSTNELLGGGSTLVNSSISRSDRFRGACLVSTDGVCVDDPGFFDVRMLHADIVLPNNLGFVRIGRQPFDWGLGIVANGGWDPLSDGGFLIDRFLWLKSWPLGTDGNFTFIFVTDYITGGTSTVTGSGNGYDVGAVALIYNNSNVGGGNLTIGAYDFPYIHQNNFAGLQGLNLDWFNLYAGIIDYKADKFRLAGEITGGFGSLEFPAALGGADVDITGHNFAFALRAEYYPAFPFKIAAGEFGWVGGNNNNKLASSGEITGGIVVMNPAYNLDNLLFKHMIPNIYQTASSGGVTRADASVVNAFYARLWGTVKFADDFAFTPQLLVAWNEETTAPLFAGQNVSSYMGTEFEGTVTWTIHPGVNLDAIFSGVIPGDGLQDLLEQQASDQVFDDSGANANQFDAEGFAWAVQARLVLYIDQFFN